jgi:hypothetical protein
MSPFSVFSTFRRLDVESSQQPPHHVSPKERFPSKQLSLSPQSTAEADASKMGANQPLLAFFFRKSSLLKKNINRFYPDSKLVLAPLGGIWVMKSNTCICKKVNGFENVCFQKISI